MINKLFGYNVPDKDDLSICAVNTNYNYYIDVQDINKDFSSVNNSLKWGGYVFFAIQDANSVWHECKPVLNFKTNDLVGFIVFDSTSGYQLISPNDNNWSNLKAYHLTEDIQL